MPRERRINTKTAERADTPKPKRKSGNQPSKAEMLMRRRLVREAMLLVMPADAIVAMVQAKLGDLGDETSEATIMRIYQQELELVVERAGEPVAIKRARQEARLLGEIAAAKGKGAFGAVASLERDYADVAGTKAPVRISHDVNVNDRQNELFKRVIFTASAERLKRLLEGKPTPLGQAATDVPATGEEVK